MSELDALTLARLQFAFTISFHIIFPAFTIGLASYLAVLEGLWLLRGDETYRRLFRFWVRIFAVSFGMGVVSGVVMSYQFGTNWSGFSDVAGPALGPLLAYEVLTAFFLEAGFLGVMLFGWNRVGPGLHFFSTLMVSIGTLISTTWILASNSWMQTPAGFEIIDGRAVPVDWLAVIFNPSFPYRLLHMTVAAFLATALFVAASAAWQLLRGRDNPAIRKMLSMAMWMLVVVAPMQAVIGDFHGLNTLKHQPAKIAAMEGHWENHPGEGVPLVVFAWPDQEREENRFALEIPRLGSLILTHSWDGQFPGLKEFPPEDRPPVAVVFWSFRIMVGLGVLMILLGACAPAPSVPTATDMPALTLVPVGEAGIRDRRARFRAILCAVTARDGLPPDRGCERALWRLADEPPPEALPMALAPARLPLHVLIDPGLAADCAAGIARPFEDALAAARAAGYRIEVLPLGNLGGVERNAGLLAGHVGRMPADDAPLVLLGYSRGASDVIEALLAYPELRSRVAAFVAMAGTINGSPLADRWFSAAGRWARYLPGAECTPEDDRGIDELRPSVRLARRAAVPGLPGYSVVTFVDHDEVSPLLRPTWDVLARIDPRNDGQVLAWDQLVPGSTLLALLRADHLMPIAPVGPLMPWWARGLVNGEDFPRAAVLETVLRLVEEDLLAAGRPPTARPAPRTPVPPAAPW